MMKRRSLISAGTQLTNGRRKGTAPVAPASRAGLELEAHRWKRPARDAGATEDARPARCSLIRPSIFKAGRENWGLAPEGRIGRGPDVYEMASGGIKPAAGLRVGAYEHAARRRFLHG